MVREVGKRLCRCGLVFLFTCGYGPCLLLLACCMTVECFSFVAFLACLVSEEQCSYRCSSWRTDGSTYSSTFYTYVQFSTDFLLYFQFQFLAPHFLVSCARVLFFFFAQSLFLSTLFSVFSGGLELLDLAGYAYDDVFYKVL